MGRAYFDAHPQFSLPDQPSDLLMRSHIYTIPEISDLPQEYPLLSPVNHALQMLSSLAENVNSNSHDPAFWEQDVTAIKLIVPVTHHLLSLPRLPQELEFKENPEPSIIREWYGFLVLSSWLGSRHDSACQRASSTLC